MAQPFAWPADCRAAVSLTYDDGLPVHYQLAAPLLARHGQRATFFPPIHSDLMLHPERWRALAAAGHELGNHTIFHPCRQTSPPYPWLDERYDLRQYTLEHMRAELEVANLVLELLDGQHRRCYGATCGDLRVGRGFEEKPLRPLLVELFIAARGGLNGQVLQPSDELDLYALGCIPADGCSLAELQQVAVQARELGGWAILVMHGIGAGSHDLYIDEGVHEDFIAWLAAQPEIWTAPMGEVVGYVRQQEI